MYNALYVRHVCCWLLTCSKRIHHACISNLLCGRPLMGHDLWLCLRGRHDLVDSPSCCRAWCSQLVIPKWLCSFGDISIRHATKIRVKHIVEDLQFMWCGHVRSPARSLFPARNFAVCENPVSSSNVVSLRVSAVLPYVLNSVASVGGIFVSHCQTLVRS